MFHLVDDICRCLTSIADEVESLAGSRSTGTSGNEPSDALRVGHTFLTDQ